jgi:exodeoxyribonuclease V alpha subunit
MKVDEDWSALDGAFAYQVWPDAPLDAERFLRQLMRSSREGHLCLRSPHHLLPEEKVYMGSDDDLRPLAPIVRQDDRYYLQRNWVLETMILHHIRRLLEAEPNDLFDPARFSVSSQLSSTQTEAIRHALSHSLTVVSGGPGTGKTYMAGQLIQSLTHALRPQRPSLKVRIAAPTGKAADRLMQVFSPMESLQIEAMTLHRLLRLYPGRCRLFEERSLDADLIVVDEASMIDASLFAHLLAAIPKGARLVLLGDADQLPPIDGGSVFADLAELQAIRLRRCFRTQDTALYEAVQNGDVKPLYNILEPLPSDLISWIDPMLRPLIFAERPDPAALLQRFDRLRLVCPLRRGPRGVDAINAALLLRLQGRLSMGQWWAAPILVTDNDAELQLYNGTPGVVIGRYQGGHLPRGTEEAILSDGRTFPLYQLPSFEIAFALSVHKSQGSEFDDVICCLPEGSEEFAREALYTALTRAKKSVRLMGDRKTLEQMIAVRSRQENGLKERMEIRSRS